MQVGMINEIWGELKRYINTVDRNEAAENMIAIMIEHDCDPEDIRESFAHDTDVKRALADYLDQGHDESEAEYEEEETDYDDENWDD